MCSVFGYIAAAGSRVRINVLADLVRGNVHRGPHAFGFAWIDASGRLRAYKQPGKLTDHLGVLQLLRGATAVVGHLRYATHGDPCENINNHPHACDGGWYVHNGRVRNYADLVMHRQLWCTSDCDSEAIGLLAEQSRRRYQLNRWAAAVGDTEGKLVTLGLWKPGTIIACRRGNPLHLGNTAEGFYMATLPAGLPGNVEPMRDDTAARFSSGEVVNVQTTQITGGAGAGAGADGAAAVDAVPAAEGFRADVRGAAEYRGG